MPTTRSDHLAKAKDYIAKGEGYYRKAAEEIVAAIDEDATLSYREVGRRLGRSDRYVRDLVKWHTSADAAASPFAGKEEPGAQEVRAARKVIRERPEAIVEAIEAAPPQARAKIRKALDQRTEDEIEQLERRKIEREAREDESTKKLRRLGAVLDVEKDLSGVLVTLSRSLELSYLPHAEQFSDADREEFAAELQEIVDVANGYKTIITSGDETLAADVLGFQKDWKKPNAPTTELRKERT